MIYRRQMNHLPDPSVCSSPLAGQNRPTGSELDLIGCHVHVRSGVSRGGSKTKHPLVFLHISLAAHCFVFPSLLLPWSLLWS